MMKTIIILFLIFISGSLTEIYSQWIQVQNGMGIRNVYDLVVNNDKILAGTSDGEIFSTSNNGNNWVQTSFNSSTVHSLFVHNTGIYAGTGSHGIYKSTNNGNNWVNVFNDETVFDFASIGNYLFSAMDSNGVYFTTNNGSNWYQTLQFMTVYSLAASGNTLLAGSADYGVYKTDNFGVNWTPTSLNNNAVFSFEVLNDKILAGTSNGIYSSTNNGLNWVHTALEDEYVTSFAVSGNNIFAGTFSAGVFVSNDNGLTWVQRNEGLTSNNSGTLCIFNNFIFNGGQLSVFRRGLGELIGIEQISSQVPERFGLSQNYPNPFNPVTNINFELSVSSKVNLTVYDVSGKVVEVLVSSELNTGKYRVDWNASKYSSGIYFYKITAGEFTRTNKMILVK